MNKRLIHDVAMATTKAVVEQFRWSDESEYRDAFLAVYPAVEGGLIALIEQYRRERKRLAKPEGEPDAPTA